MRTYLTNSTAAFKAGISPGINVFKVTTGPHAGRMVILMQTSSSEIKLSYADFPYTVWSTPSVILSDCADFTFDAVMDNTGHVFCVYTLNSTHDLVCRRLGFSGGGWTAETLRTIYSSDDNYYPSLALDVSGHLWVAWTRIVSGSAYLNVKSSADNGVSWGVGASDAGETLTSGASSAYAKCLTFGSYLYVLYTLGGTVLACRRRHADGGVWDGAVELAGGTALDHNFDASISRNGQLGVAYDDNAIRFREFDGVSWSGIVEIDSVAGDFPQITYFKNTPYVTYLREFGSGQSQAVYSRRLTDSFSTPLVLDNGKVALDGVLCYHAASGTYDDLTSAAGDSVSGDICHGESSAMVQNVGDAMYIGHGRPFHYVKILLASSGVGGTVLWQYFNGQDWVSFTPSGGACHLDSPNRELLLWDDYQSLPSDWQPCPVNNRRLYWIRIAVSASFTTAPVGTQITSVPNAEALVLMEQ
ncbi:MAG: hypothetical protein JW763_07010 [candidate division Zixibacteria bacterium]|nr:hypothetical protein [candidate division Zixibacteria bacterium]